MLWVQTMSLLPHALPLLYARVMPLKHVSRNTLRYIISNTDELKKKSFSLFS